MRVKTVFIDRDGVINDNRSDHVQTWDDFVFLPGALEGLALLTHAQIRIFVISNQGITHAATETIHRRMIAIAESYGAHIEAVLSCSHRNDATCDCRSPKSGLLHHAQDRYDVALDKAYFIGDHSDDISAGQAVGCKCVLVLTGHGHATLQHDGLRHCKPVMIAPDLRHAAEYITTPRATTRRLSRPAWAERQPAY